MLNLISANVANTHAFALIKAHIIIYFANWLLMHLALILLKNVFPLHCLL